MFSHVRHAAIVPAVLVLLLVTAQQKAVAQGCSSVDFKVAPTFESTVGNGYPWAGYAVADFDGNGKPDVAETDYSAGSVVVLLNDGTGRLIASKVYPTGTEPRDVAVGDFNGDGRPDLVVTNSQSNNISVLLNSGSGLFSAATNFAVGPSPLTIAVGDFNGDGKQDLAVGNNSNQSISVLLGNGNGSFIPAVTLLLPSFASPSELVVSDFNSDGKRDFAAATQNGLYMFLGDGLGGFGTAKISDLSGLALATADFNNDGKADLALGAFNGVLIRLGDGAGGFSAGVNYPHEGGSRIAALAVGDVDGDTKLDVVVGGDSPGGISFLKGDGTGSFTTTRNYLPSKNMGDIALGDFDSDGDVDIVSGESILTNLGGGVFEAMRPVYSTTSAAPFDVALGDFNGDGLSDLAVAHRPLAGGAPVQGVAVLLRSASGNFARFPINFTTSTVNSMATADFNKDGRTDVAVALTRSSPFGFIVSIHLSNGDGTFAAPSTINLSGQATDMATGDFNNDGNPDLVVTGLQGSITRLLGNGSGGFSLGFPPSAGTFAHVAVADLNNDNKADLILTDYSGMQVWTELGDGNGFFGTPHSFAVAGRPNAVTVGDFNQDGKIDVVVANENTNSGFFNDGSASVLLGDGAGNLGAAVNYALGVRPVGILASDLDGDGKLDLATANDGSSTISVLSGEGNGTFRSTVAFSVWGRPQEIVVSDIDSDGRSDLAASLVSSITVGILYGKAASSQPCLSVDDVTITEGDTGSLMAEIPIRLSSPSTSVVSVAYALKAGSATEGQDFTGGGGIVTFQPGETSRTVPVPIPGDLSDENNETFTLNLSGAVNARISDGIAQVSIVDNDPAPAIFINDVTVAEGNSFVQNSATFTVTLSAPSAKTISVSFAAVSGTATLGQDFDGAQGVLTISPGVTSRTITVNTRGDATYEPDETFFVNLSNPSEATIADGQGQGTILNDDPLPAITINNAFGSEAASADSTMTVTVQLSNTSSSTITVDFATADDTATVGADYVAASGTLTFNPGETQKTITITIKHDLIDETSETFFINLTNPTNSTVADGQSLCTISDNDGPAVSINDVSVTEGASSIRNVAFTLTLSAASPQAVSVRLATADGTALAPTDYTRVTTRTVIIPAGSTSVTTSISVVGDIAIEPDETFLVNLSQPQDGTIADGQGVGTIVNDDVTSVQFSTDTMTVNETDGSAQVTVLHVGDVSQPITALYSTFDLNATQKSDYSATLGQIQFAAGETSKTITIFITDDALVENQESFFINLNGPGGARTNSPATVTININSNDVAGAPNPIDSSDFFVRQHYRDFLSRDPDPDGLAFWINQIESCGSDIQCREARRINVSASFFLSIEFQQTGYLVERFYKTAFGDTGGVSNFGSTHQILVPVVRFLEFIQDTQRIGRGVVVLQPGWEQLLESNKQAYASEFVQTDRFISSFPTSMTPDQFVDKLNQNAGSVLSATERGTIINLFGGAADTGNTTARAQAIRQVAEDTDLYNAEYNRAFVLTQYFGYLRRNPFDPQDTDYTGYDFWLTKLNQFNGNYINAEMVKAFLSSIEYRQRFGP